MKMQGQLIETRKALITAILPALAIALLLLPHWSARCTFREVAPGVLRCRQSAAPMGPGAGFEFTLLRVEETKGFIFKKRLVHHILVDGGAPNTIWGSFASGLVDGVERALRPKGRRGAKEPLPKLDLIILTHGHTTGALHQLLAKYPDCPVLMHSEEAPFLIGNSTTPYYDPEKSSLRVKLYLWTGLLLSKVQSGVPPERAALIHGEGGDVADALRASKVTKKSMRWLPRGVLRYIHVPGHTPGSTALLHQPSKLLLAGDAVLPRKTWFGGAPTLTVAGKGIASDPAAELASAKRLLLQENYSLLLPTHCAGARCSFDKQTAVAIAEAWPEEAASLMPGPATRIPKDVSVDVETEDRHIL